MPTFPRNSFRLTRGYSKSLRRAIEIILLGFALYSSQHASAQPQQTTQAPSDDHIQQILRTLEPDNTLRWALEKGGRGDGVHYSWMDAMRQFGFKQAAFEIHFQSALRKNDLKITAIKYLRQYYRYDRAIADATMIEQIRASGLEETLSSEILSRSRIFLIQQNHDLGLTNSCGILYVNLLDDEVLPILDAPADREDCKPNGTRSSMSETQTVRLTSKQFDPPSPPLLAARVVHEETYHKVLDLVFPRNVLKDQNSDFAFVLRYEPAFRAESQITIVARDGKIEVIRYSAVGGSIEAKLNQIVQRTHRQDARRMARQIRIQKEYVKLSPKEIKLLHESFFDKLRLSENTRLDADKNQIVITADGTSYRLWYRGETEVQTDFIGSNITTATRRDESPLVDWMKRVYLKVTAPSATAHR